MHFAGGPKNKIYLQFPLPEDVEKRKLVGGDFAVGARLGKLSHVLCKMEMVWNLRPNTRPASTIKNAKGGNPNRREGLLFFAILPFSGRPNEIFALWQVQSGELQLKAFPVSRGMLFRNHIFFGSFNLSAARSGMYSPPTTYHTQQQHK